MSITGEGVQATYGYDAGGFRLHLVHAKKMQLCREAQDDACTNVA